MDQIFLDAHKFNKVFKIKKVVTNRHMIAFTSQNERSSANEVARSCLQK